MPDSVGDSAFIGMLLDKQAPSGEGLVYYARNMIPLFRGRPSAYGMRPGFVQNADLSGAGAGAVQAVGHFHKTDGTPVNYAISGGEIYDYNSLTRVISSANLSTASITLATSGLVYVTPFAGSLIINDGTNQPFAWDGTTAGGLTALTSTPSVCFGYPTVYSGRLFFIKDSLRTEFVWSEANQPNVGYEAGGYNNAWNFTQTSDEPIQLLIGTNGGLFVYRGQGITAVIGSVNANFRSASTRDSVSERHGISHPTNAVFHDGSIWFADHLNRPWVHVVATGEVVPVWSQLADLYRRGQGSSTLAFGLDDQLRSDFHATGAVMWFAYDAAAEAFVMFIDGGTSNIQYGIAFDPISYQCLGIYALEFDGLCVGQVEGTTHHLEQLAIGHESNGGVYTAHPTVASTDSRDRDDAGTLTQLTGTLVGRPYGGGRAQDEHDFSGVTVTCMGVDDRLGASSQTVELDFFTPAEHHADVIQSSQTKNAVWTEAVTSEVQDPAEMHLNFGIEATGRWLRPRIQVTKTYTGVSHLMVMGIQVQLTTSTLTGDVR